jgi:hypothetical protein
MDSQNTVSDKPLPDMFGFVLQRGSHLANESVSYQPATSVCLVLDSPPWCTTIQCTSRQRTSVPPVVTSVPPVVTSVPPVGHGTAYGVEP